MNVNNYAIVHDIRKLSRIVTNIFNQNLKEVDINVTQLGLLNMLRNNPLISQRALSKELILDHTTLSRDLHILCKSGYIQPVDYKDDKRIRCYELTESGNKILDKGQSQLDRLGSGFMLETFSKLIGVQVLC